MPNKLVLMYDKYAPAYGDEIVMDKAKYFIEKALRGDDTFGVTFSTVSLLAAFQVWAQRGLINPEDIIVSDGKNDAPLNKYGMVDYQIVKGIPEVMIDIGTELMLNGINMRKAERESNSEQK
jgi:hypothetical protein